MKKLILMLTLSIATFANCEILLSAEVENQAVEEEGENEKNKSSTSKHKFKHEIPYASRDYEDPVSAAWKTGFKGALVGLGSGVAVHLVQYSVTSKSNPASGRIIAGLTGTGFIAGAIWGGLSAHYTNKSLDNREKNYLEKYGSISPNLIFANNHKVSGFGLDYSIRF